MLSALTLFVSLPLIFSVPKTPTFNFDSFFRTPSFTYSRPTITPPSLPTTTTTTATTTNTTTTQPAPATPPTTVNPQPTTTTTQPTTQPASTTTDVQTYLLNAINSYRASQGLSAAKSDPYTCNFAAKRAGEITTDFSHNGFKNFPYPSYHLVTENIAMNSDYHNVVPAWIASSGHAANMRADTPYICVAQNGNYFAMEGWKP